MVSTTSSVSVISAIFIAGSVTVGETLGAGVGVEENPNFAPKDQGSLIVFDKDISNYNDKTSTEFQKMIQTIRREGLSEEHRQHIKDFKLLHACFASSCTFPYLNSSNFLKSNSSTTLFEANRLFFML